MMKQLLHDAQSMEARIVAHRRYLHENAECGFALEKTCAYVEKVLREIGYAPHPCGKCGIVAEIGIGDAESNISRTVDIRYSPAPHRGLFLLHCAEFPE